MNHPVILAARRTPIGKFGGSLAKVPSPQLGAFAIAAALAGTVDIRPKPNDATATSAMRFRSVFVDMFFLSVSRRRESLCLRLVIQRDLAIAPLHHFLQATWVTSRNLCV